VEQRNDGNINSTDIFRARFTDRNTLLVTYSTNSNKEYEFDNVMPTDFVEFLQPES